MSFTSNFKVTNHRRYNPLKQEWVLVSPHRALRPWQGAVEKADTPARPQYDPACYLCPGNTRANSEKNPQYANVFCFDNDFSALSPKVEWEGEGADKEALNGIIRAAPGGGRCRVVCFSPRHDLTLAELTVEQIVSVIDIWEEEYRLLAATDGIQHVMTFENKGQIMGCSNPHPHGQIWATAFIPNSPLRALSAQDDYTREHHASLLTDYLEWELKEEERLVCANENWVALVPFWALWPFESMILPRRAASKIADLSPAERHSWAAIMKELATRYDNLFLTSFPYSQGIYQIPTAGRNWEGFMLHQVFFPPLLRSATVKKFMVGFELCAEPQRDLTAEQAAERLRGLPAKHYKEA